MKRIFDIVVSFVLMVFFSPVFLLLFLWVKLSSKGPAIHWSKRVGINHTFFKMPKFRSMYVDTPDVATHLLQDSQSYITPVGRVLRKTSLDELPQLWSIFIGDMSFVGPRPALHNQDDLMALRTEMGVEKCKPGLTGWAQINGRDEISIPEKVKLEHYYLQHQSFFFDMKILFITFFGVLFSRGISH